MSHRRSLRGADCRPGPGSASSQADRTVGHAAVIPAEVEVADRAIRGIFAAVLPLASARSLTRGVARRRLDESIGAFDALVEDLRVAVSASEIPAVEPEQVIEGRWHPLDAGGDAEPPPERDLVDLAADALGTVDEVLAGLWAAALTETGDGCDTLPRITDAARLVRLARITLIASARR